MALFCKLSGLHNESDVEQQFFFPLLTNTEAGLGISSTEILTKSNIRQFAIEKGPSTKIYRPDYIAILGGLPTIVCEVKRPGEDLDEALREARLYAAELNAAHPSGVNPVVRLIVSDGKRTITSPADTAIVDYELEFDEISLANQRYQDFRELLSPKSLRAASAKLQRRATRNEYYRPVELIGGEASRDEDIGYNTFGRQLSIDYLHVFNPQTRVHRSHIVRNAYVASRRREHYVDEIDRVIRMSLPSPVHGSTLLDDAEQPTALIRVLRRGRDLLDKLFLLIGPVGAGKSTFIDYFREVKLPPEIVAETVWVSVDMNKIPHERTLIEQWLVDQITHHLESTRPEIDFESPDIAQKVLAVDLRRQLKLAGQFLKAGSDEYNRAVFDAISRLLSDRVTYAKALARYLCADTSKLLVLVLDNCDKGDRDQQLLIFEIVKWVQSWLQCLAFLPIRDVTYYTFRDRPPLDTVIPEFVFRIETPPFTEVLTRRIKLALTEMSNAGGEQCEYFLENGMRVVYPRTDLGYYLACIQKSIYDHDRLLRKMMLGLAGRNMRKAMEIFLDFCKSGHIGEKEYLQIRLSHGQYSLPYGVITRVLLRSSSRYYDGTRSHVKNLFQCDTDDLAPDHFVRLAVLTWLHVNMRQKGPTGLQGFHRCERVLGELTPLGHDEARVRKEIKYLVSSMCILTEHQRNDDVQDDELIRLSTAGVAHLSMLANVHYLAACAEDTFVNDRDLARSIANRIGSRSTFRHYGHATINANATDFLAYLKKRVASSVAAPDSYLTNICFKMSDIVNGIADDVAQKSSRRNSSVSWPEVDGKYIVGSKYYGKVHGVKSFGVFVTLEDGLQGLAHVSRLPVGKSIDSFRRGDPVEVRVTRIDSFEKRIAITIVSEKQ